MSDNKVRLSLGVASCRAVGEHAADTLDEAASSFREKIERDMEIIEAKGGVTAEANMSKLGGDPKKNAARAATFKRNPDGNIDMDVVLDKQGGDIMRLNSAAMACNHIIRQNIKPHEFKSMLKMMLFLLGVIEDDGLIKFPLNDNEKDDDS